MTSLNINTLLLLKSPKKETPKLSQVKENARSDDTPVSNFTTFAPQHTVPIKRPRK